MDALPPEVVKKVMENLPIHDSLRLCDIVPNLVVYRNDEDFWRDIVENLYPGISLSPNKTWKGLAIYLALYEMMVPNISPYNRDYIDYVINKMVNSSYPRKHLKDLLYRAIDLDNKAAVIYIVVRLLDNPIATTEFWLPLHYYLLQHKPHNEWIKNFIYSNPQNVIDYLTIFSQINKGEFKNVLYLAALLTDPNTLKYFFANHPQYREGQYLNLALNYAAYGSVENVKYLISLMPLPSLESPIISAILANNIPVLEYLINLKCNDIQERPKCLSIYVLQAVKFGTLPMVKFLISLGGNIDPNLGMKSAIEGTLGKNPPPAPGRNVRELVDYFIAQGANDWRGGLFAAISVKNEYLRQFFKDKLASKN